MAEELSKRDFWLLTFVTFFSMACQGFMSNTHSVTGVIMRNDFGADYNAYAACNAFGGFGYVFFSTIAAIILPKFGFKTTFLCGFIGGLIGCLLLASSPNYVFVILFSFLMSAGPSLTDTAPTTLASIIFTKHTAAFFSIMNLFYGIGAILGPSFSGLVYAWLPQYSFRGIYIGVSIIVAILSIYVIFCPFAVKYPPVDEPKEGDKSSLTIWTCLKNPMVWLFSLILMTCGMAEGAPSNWAGLYIVDVLHLDTNTVTIFSTVYYIVFSIARLFGGFMADYIGYYTTMYIVLTCTILLYIAGFMIDSFGLWLICATGICTAFYWPTFMCVIIKFFGPISAIPISVVLPMQAAIGALAQFPLGWLNDSIGPEWAFRITPVFCVICIIMIIYVQIIQHNRDKKKDLEEGLLTEKNQEEKPMIMTN